MNKITKSYGICVKECEIQNRNTNERNQLIPGVLIRILETETSASNKIIIKLYNSDENIFKSDLFECSKSDVDYVVETLWPFLIGTKENEIRLRIFHERELVLQLKCGAEITIKSYENDANADIKGVVELIDTVKDVGIGNFVGLKLNGKPKNRVPVVTLYKKHFNQSTSLLLFRIDQLLDALKNNKNDIHKSPESNSDVKASIVRQVPLYASPRHSLVSSHSYVRPPEVNPVQKDNTKRNTGSTELRSPEKSFYDSNLSSSQPVLSELTNKMEIRVINKDPVVNEISTSHVVDRAIKEKDAITRIKEAGPIQQNVQESSLVISKQNNALKSKPIKNNTEVVNKKQSSNTVQSSSAMIPIVRGVSVCSESADVSNLQSAVAETENCVTIKKTNNRYNKMKTKAPNGVAVADSLNVESPQCSICNIPYSDDMLVLKCKHSVCLKCFGIQILTSKANRVQCPFRSCRYRLQNFEMANLRKKMNASVSCATTNTQPPSKCNDSNVQQEMAECTADQSFKSTLCTENLFKCSLCEIDNGVHCKHIHENIMHLAEQLNSLIVAFKPTVEGAAELQQIPAKTNVNVNKLDKNITFMKCLNEQCGGEWFILKIDTSTIFKCPVCELYTCITCNAVHQNQSCNIVKAVDEPKTKSNTRIFSKSNNARPQFIPNHRNGSNTKIKWSCSYCTFDNFNAGRYCNICRKPNNAK